MFSVYNYTNLNNASISHTKYSHFFQPKLTVNRPDDVYEQEADAIADKVMRTPDSLLNNNLFFRPAISTIQPKCAHCGEENNAQRNGNSLSFAKGFNEVDSSHAESYTNALSGGRILNEKERNFFEIQMGYDFSNVKIHTDAIAAKSAQSINALAYTSGNNIVFNEGQYQPYSNSGKRLLAHELAHVIQQKNNGAKIQRLVRTTEIKNCKDQSETPSSDLLAAEQMAFDLLRKGIDKIQIAEDEYHQAVHKYLGPTADQLKEFTAAFEMAKSLSAAFGVSGTSEDSWQKLHIIKVRLMKTISYLDQVVFQYVCLESGDMCPAKRDAFVDTNKDHRTINLCPKFWGSSQKEQGFTIAHEIMHLWGGGFMKDTTEDVFGITKITPRFQDVNRYENFLRLITS